MAKTNTESKQETSNSDKRLAVSEGAGISGDHSSISVDVESVDADLIARSLDTVDTFGGVAVQGFERLVTAFEDMTENSNERVAAAYSEANGAIDNKTVVIGLAGLATAAALMTRGK